MNKAVLLFLSVIFFCCSENDPKKIEFDSSYFPLQVGNYWEYVPISPREDTLSVQVEIPSTATIGDYEYYLMVSKYVYTNGAYVSDSSYYRVDSKGYVLQKTTRDLEEANPFRLAAPDGETWTIHAPPLTDFVVTTGATTPLFLKTITIENCKPYYYDLPGAIDDEHSITLAPGLGIVTKITGEGLSSKLKKATIGGTEYNF